MTLPTKLTLIRIGLTFLIMAILFVPGWMAKLVALTLFLLAGATDWLDGHLARRWKQTSPVGALLDPIADKILVLGIFLAFVQLRLVPAWMVLIILIRELLITGVRLVAASRHLVLSAAKEGKHKTVSQLLTICIILAALTVQEFPGIQPLPWPVIAGVRWSILSCLWITTGLTVVSGTAFFWRHRAVLKDVVSR